MSTSGGIHRISPSFEARDIFSRLRVSQPIKIFDSQQAEHLDLSHWEILTSGTGAFAFNANRSSGTLSTTALNDVIVREQHGYNHYIPGKAVQILCTCVFGAGQADVVKRVGYLNDNDGVYLEQDGTDGFFLVRRTSTSGVPVEADRVAQTSWNLDKLDGTGSSGKTLDPTKIQILVIEFSWLGAGSVRWGFDFGGEITYVHEINYGNTITTTWSAVPNLPIRFEMRQNGATTGSFVQVCTAAQSEGGAENFGLDSSISNNGVAQTLAAGARNSILTCRLKTLLPTSGLPNRRIVVPSGFSLITDKDVLVELVSQHITEGAPVFGGTPVWADVGSFSGLEFAEDVTTVGPGHIFFSSYVQGGTRAALGGVAAAPVESLLEPPSYLARNSNNDDSDYVHLVVTNLEGQTATLYGALNFKEVF